MLLDEKFDADEHLRDLDDYDRGIIDDDGEVKEVDFDGEHSAENFNEMMGTMDNPEDMWE